MRSNSRHVLFVHAHPDDETIATGGTIAALVDAGVGVTVLTCTRGERGEVIPPHLAHLEGDGPSLAERRVGELADAMRVLGVDDQRYLGQPDARLPELEPRRYLDSGMVWGESGPEPVADPDADSLCSAPLEEVVADIATVIADVQPSAVVSYDADGGYGHPDHRRAHQAAREAAMAMAVPFFEIEDPADDAPAGGHSVDVSGVLDRKIRAMQSHATQITVDGDHYALSSGPSMPVPAMESYRRVGASEPDLPFEQQPFGSRALACTVSLVLGLGVGLLGTVTHPATITVAGAALPTGLLAAILVVTTLMVGLRLVFGSRAPSTFAAIGLVAVLLVFAQAGPGGSVLIPANTPGYVWTYGVPLIAALVIVWPRLPARSGG
jgi:N-acetyl-1-D-myo-inositol-2-amino-2-deoxy-alpha-D-glucopyranoside deacetylase